MKTLSDSKTTALVIAIACTVACGPRPDTQEPDDTDQTVQTTGGEDEAAAAAAAEEARREELLAEYNTLINALNTAIENQDEDGFEEIFTVESHQLFVRISLMDMAISGVTDLTPQQHVLEQQKDFNVVYGLDEVDFDAGTAMLVGVIRDSGEEIRFPLAFVEEDGELKIDYSDVLDERLANLTASRMELMVAELTKAIAKGDAKLYASVITEQTAETCPDFLGILPPPKGGKQPKLAAAVKSMKKKAPMVGVENVDTKAYKATLTVTIGEESLEPVMVNFVIDAGDMRIEASSRCEVPAQ